MFLKAKQTAAAFLDGVWPEIQSKQRANDYKRKWSHYTTHLDHMEWHMKNKTPAESFKMDQVWQSELLLQTNPGQKEGSVFKGFAAWFCCNSQDKHL